MDIVYFLKARTSFIRFYYDQSVVPFAKIKQQIENQLPPYEDPPYSEDSERSYLEEWMDADTGIRIAGLSCITLLSDSLKLYSYSLQRRVIGFSFGNEENEKKVFKKGFFLPTRAFLGYILDTDWSDCPADLKIIEQVVPARNRGQHTGDLTSFHVSHDKSALRLRAITVTVHLISIAVTVHSIPALSPPCELIPVTLRCEPTGPAQVAGPMTGSASLEGRRPGASAASFEGRFAATSG